jgi:hypothetical protein
VAVEGTIAGRAHQLGEILANDNGGGRMLWVPMLHGADRAGVQRVRLGPGVVDEDRCAGGAGLCPCCSATS